MANPRKPKNSNPISKKPVAPKSAAQPRQRTVAPRGGQGKVSALDAAVKVLKESGGGGPMNCKQMVDAMLAKKYWTTDGKTPAATLSSAIMREITTKGKESRFKKTGRGSFAHTT